MVTDISLGITALVIETFAQYEQLIMITYPLFNGAPQAAPTKS